MSDIEGVVKDDCPNCGKVGSHYLAAGESGADHDEYRCDNPNCRVAYYEVEPCI